MAQPALSVEASDLRTLNCLVRAHLDSLVFPFDSWTEDFLLNSALYLLRLDGCDVGYAAMHEDTLSFFHVRRDHLVCAPDMFRYVVAGLGVKRVQVMTLDAQLCALIAEWEYRKEMSACLFIDVRAAKTGLLPDAVFCTAVTDDIPDIFRISGDFFNQADNNFSSLEQRITAGILFTLKEDGCLLGCGIIEKSCLIQGIASIGMFVAKEHRQRGAATRILAELKAWAYANNLTPVAGCGYNNTLSRKSLEAAGMAVAGIAYDAVLVGRIEPPPRTGNPPEETVQ